MKKFLFTVLTIWLLSKLIPGIHVDSIWSALLVAVVIALLGLTIGTFMQVIALPITIITFGLFAFVVNAILIMLAAWLMDSFSIDSFWYALLLSVTISIVQSFLKK